MNMVVTRVCLVMVIFIYFTGVDTVAQDHSENEIEDESMEDLLSTEEYGLCQRVHVKDCTITMKKMVTPVMVRKCHSLEVVRGDTAMVG